ncbi:UDP-2,3-diacylglucosamine diphosphatase [Sphingobacteriales bacterium UPWRP_1]|nr:UDP-2,3-diacylglucosamine hydrolase [Sphingobacteriales bacterium TSM_CSS]PSJ72171.1 UDP-2,3-diacylglucosamine diphosphatase [Sphingobacteriales bacterium UPWRP_1]
MQKKKVDIAVISDTHLGTYGCHARELLLYLKSIEPGILILNGDIIDGWNFSKSYFPKEHFAVVKKLMKFLALGTKVYYITGNHDEFLRRFSGFSLGNFHLIDKLKLQIDGKQTLFFHGDVFDTSITGAKWLAKIGGSSYDWLIRINKLVNNVLKWLGKPPMSLSKKVKDSVKRAVKFVSDFEQAAADFAIDNGYDYVVCGHIHQPQMRRITSKTAQINYLNSGDWIENLSALEFYRGEWHLYHFPQENNNPDVDMQYRQWLDELTSYYSSVADNNLINSNLALLYEDIVCSTSNR